MCAGFQAGTRQWAPARQRDRDDVEYLEIGDRTPGDAASYPDDDLAASFGADGRWHYRHKDGTPY